MVCVVNMPTAIRRPVDFSWSGNDSGVQPRKYQLRELVAPLELVLGAD